MSRFTRSATFAPSTFDAQALTVEAIASTFADVIRRDARGPFIERLDPATLDLSGLNGAPLLNSHKSGDSRDVVGVVTGHRIEEGKLIVGLRLSQAADAAPTVQRILERTIRGLSIGYVVSAWNETVENGTRVKTAARWRVSEVSAVAIPADAGATFRNKESTMNAEELAALMGNLSRRMTLPDDFATRAADLPLAEVLALAEEEGEEIQPEPKPKKRTAPVIRTATPQNDDPAVIVRRQSDALIARATGTAAPADAQEYRHLSLMDFARDALTRSGTSHRGMSNDEVLHRAAHGTSDFPLVVSNMAGKMALDAYRAAETPLKRLSRKRSLSNFKESTSIRMGGMGRLEPLTESGEFKATSRAESGEKMKLGTFGRRFDISRQLIIDDDLGLMSDTVSALGQGAAQTEADILVDLLLNPPVMSDEVAVFHASRGNVHDVVLAATSDGWDGLSEMRAAMRKVTDLDGKTIIGAAPKFLLIGPDLEGEAEKLMAANLSPIAPGDVNPVRLEILVEPRLADSVEFWLFADPATRPTLAHAYLSGAEGVQIQRQEAWNTLGLSFRAFLDFGAAWFDWRGASKSTGTAPG
ncbi:HK97 family phage prohead protease [Rhodobacter sp. SY28-1]|uniref:phage major capsid protein n=1 Tax=Rhodobacter sp. SY28-1 TaxID=2562317 RepID=UPI0010C01B1C|nr:HK97 family phage prohead protease [Rhodobacter sp. SY28-1]